MIKDIGIQGLIPDDMEICIDSFTPGSEAVETPDGAVSLMVSVSYTGNKETM